MGIVSKLAQKYPQLKGKEWKIKQIMDLFFYALFLLLIWNSRPIYVDYCSTNPALNVSELKDAQAYWATHNVTDMLPNITEVSNASFPIQDVNGTNSSVYIGHFNDSWMYMNP